jgi:hypothetical protein
VKPASLFLRKQTVWVPTLLGWLALLLLGAVAAVALVRSVYPFLAVTEPVGAPILVVEGWLSQDELDRAIRVFRAGSYERVLTTGGPLHSWRGTPNDSTYAHRAADYLIRHGLSTVPVTPVPSPITHQDRTYTSAQMVRAWARRSGVALEKLDVLSRGPHARRSRFLYEEAFGPDVRIGVIAVRPEDYPVAGWWHTSTGALDVAQQAAGFFWVKFFFNPLQGPGREQDSAIRTSSTKCAAVPISGLHYIRKPRLVM